MRQAVLWASQRTEVLALIKTTTALNVRDFRWTVVHSRKSRGTEVARLEYIGDGRHCFFQFDRHQGQHYAIYGAGGDGAVEEHFPGTWERQALYFAGWAARVDAEARGGRVPRSP
jgi:hypothetical protein